jgi:hypothetical protein
MRITVLLSCAIALGFIAHTSGADPEARNRGINRRQENQQNRIEAGVKSGELTAAELRTLASERDDIKKRERAYRADGVLTPAERKELDAHIDIASRDILKQKHDAQQR